MTFISKIDRVFNDLITSRHSLSIEEIGRRKLFIIFLFILVPPLILYGMELIENGVYDQGIIDFIVVLIIIILVVVLNYQNNGKYIYRIAAILLELFLFFIIRAGTFQGYASMWALSFPLFVFFLLGKKEGILWTCTCFLFTAALFINPLSIFSDFSYPPQYLSRHLLIYFLISLFTYNYESVREKYKGAIEAEQAQLIQEKEKLAESKAEADAANRLLESEVNVRKQTENELRKHQDHLEDIVAERTSEITKNSLEKEKLQDQLAQSQKMEALGSLVGGLAHDFNNFLAGIIGSFDLLTHALVNEKLSNKELIEKYLHLGMESSKRSAGLINQLLILSKRHEIKLAPLDIRNSISHIHELCRNSFPKSIELDFRTDEAPLVIMGDLVQIEQVLLNLCINASHAMTIMHPSEVKHGGTLTVTAEKIESDYFMKEHYPDTEGIVDHWIRINVSDTGVGIDDDAKQRIYEPFFTTKNESTGLGLAISYNIIKKHGGIINVYSEPGSGTCFSLYFPVYNDSIILARDDHDKGIASGSGTVLIIDDEPLILSIAEKFLELCGYSVITAEGGDAGIAIFKNEHSRISAVLLDLSMPGKSGLEVFRELYGIDAAVKAILSSGMLDNETKDKALEMGIRGIVNKPYTAAELSEKIKMVLS